MKVITNEEFSTFPVVDGYKQCPSGDYSQITYFRNNCIFEDNCIFGNNCTFEEGSIFCNLSFFLIN